MTKHSSRNRHEAKPANGRQRRRDKRHYQRRSQTSGGGAAQLSQSNDLKTAAHWMNFHESALMPARRRGGETEVRHVLRMALSDGVICLNDVQFEQEVRDVMSAPDYGA